LRESGTASFIDVTAEVGLEHYTNSIAATWLDVNRDGRLDLLITNVLPTTLPDYATPTRLNLFHLPQPQFRGDERMFHFMHDSWNDARNGGQKELFLAGADGRFVRQDARAWGMPETRWSLAVGTADFNHDGWTDIYVANDFGPDDLYFNEGGKRFRAIRGRIFGSIGKDTYKGMNVSTGDLDRNGWEDVYVSDVHHALQAEGSLAWMFGPDSIRDQATQLGLLNEERFGWGAAIADVNNDGWLDVVQANGMVDDSIDRTSGDCADYWYVNEKVARSAPSIHSYANKWGDIRGMCIFGREQNRVYLNRGDDARPRFADVADEVGVTALTNSRGVAAVDLDSDGRLDLVITHMFQPPTIYRNVARADAREAWIGFELPLGRSSITLRYIDRHGKPVSQMREVTLVNGFSAQSDPRLHFGLGDYGSGLVAEVRWLGGGTSVLRELRLNAYQPLTLPRPEIARSVPVRRASGR